MNERANAMLGKDVTRGGCLLLQRKCVCGGSAGMDGECEECHKQGMTLQRSSVGQTPSLGVFPVAHAMRSSSPRLPDQAMHSNFGHEFSKIRLVKGDHVDQTAGMDHARQALFTDFGNPQRPAIFRTANGQPSGQAAPKSQPASAPDAGAAPSPSTAQPHACVVSERIPEGRTGVMALQGQVNDYFQMNVDWTNSGPGCDCRCGEYRQFVKGHIRVNGKNQQKRLFGGAVLEENNYHEDADDDGKPYGHRDGSDSNLDRFSHPDRGTGCSYRGRDMPGAAINSGVHLDLLLTFKGQSFDVCKNTLGKVNEWTVSFNDIVP